MRPGNQSFDFKTLAVNKKNVSLRDANLARTALLRIYPPFVDDWKRTDFSRPTKVKGPSTTFPGFAIGEVLTVEQLSRSWKIFVFYNSKSGQHDFASSTNLPAIKIQFPSGKFPLGYSHLLVDFRYPLTEINKEIKRMHEDFTKKLSALKARFPKKEKSATKKQLRKPREDYFKILEMFAQKKMGYQKIVCKQRGAKKMDASNQERSGISRKIDEILAFVDHNRARREAWKEYHIGQCSE